MIMVLMIVVVVMMMIMVVVVVVVMVMMMMMMMITRMTMMTVVVVVVTGDCMQASKPSRLLLHAPSLAVTEAARMVNLQTLLASRADPGPAAVHSAAVQPVDRVPVQPNPDRRARLRR